jgi:Zn-finger nucleic acid-binding protein
MRLREGRECLICDYCRSVYFPEKNEDGSRVLDQPSQLSCPVCAMPLMHALADVHQLLYCNRCRGALIPVPVFMRLLRDLRARHPDHAATAHPPDPEELKRHIRCPQCQREMDAHDYAGPGNVVIDDCPFCELNWLDAGELMTVVRAPDHSSFEAIGE